MNIECPNCKKEIDVTDKLPELACDNDELECDCGCRFEYGWYAVAEIRGVCAVAEQIYDKGTV